jgi:hypothetical protein
MVKWNDWFGHTINLNFNQKGDTHNTIIGGIFSIAIKLFMFIYICILWKKMVLSEGNDLSSEEFIY